MDQSNICAVKKRRGKGPYDIVVASQVSLLRNLEYFPFPHLASESERSEIFDFIWREIGKEEALRGLYLSSNEGGPMGAAFDSHFWDLSLDPAGEGRVTILSHGEPGLAITVNQEEHLRVQGFAAGLELDRAFKIAEQADDLLSGNLPYAFLPEFGYLAESVVGIGPGIRASVVLHLPGLMMNDEIDPLSLNMYEANMVMLEGIFTSGDEVFGNFYYLYKNAAFPQSEAALIAEVKEAASLVAEKEMAAREALLKEERLRLTDEVLRSFATLTHAKLLSFEEAVDNLSMLLVGADLELLSRFKSGDILDLIASISPDAMAIRVSDDDDAQDGIRADVIKKRLFEMKEGG